MTRLQASEFVSSLTVESADALSVAVVDYSEALEQLRVCVPSRRPYWAAQVIGAKERLISVIASEEATDPLAGRIA